MPSVFTPYQKFVLAVLSFLQFTIILDFMIISPLGALLLPQLHITTRQFGLVVSVYAFSAGVSGLLAAGFADKFDRKQLLLFFYTGFLMGTLLCGVAGSYRFLLVARIVTGVFGGVVGSIILAIVADLFPIEVRGRVMGTIQTAFAASQVFGLPLGVILSSHWGWHAPFMMILAVGVPVGVVIATRMQPIVEHLKVPSTRPPLQHVLTTVSQGRYLRTFLATTMLTTGGFMLMPFGSAFTVNNLGIPFDVQKWVYGSTGVVTLGFGPLLGRVADSIGKYKLFVIGTIAGAAIVAVYCNLGRTPLATVVAINAVLFIAITSRIISASALISAVPDLADRGAFMSVNAAVQQFAGGIASSLAGLIVVQQPDGHLSRYDVLGYVVVGAMAATIVLMYPIHRAVMRKMALGAAAKSATAAAAE
ncbi:MAG TPA: MFS transporter [Polyangia bacterium]|jgi:predicted MFS family arabinose efflux permease|nr:MFS transporter [Polyangia bacterium]